MYRNIKQLILITFSGKTIMKKYAKSGKKILIQIFVQNKKKRGKNRTILKK